MRRHTLLLAGLIALAPVLGLAGCGPAASPAPTSEPPPTATAVPATPETEVAPTEITPEDAVRPTGSMVIPPRITLVDQGGALFEGQQGSFCWPQAGPDGAPGPGLCADYMFPAEFKSRMQHPAGVAIEIRFDEPPDTANVALYGSSPQDPLASGEVPVTGDTASWQVDQPPGDYILMVSGFWEGTGDNTVFFGLTLE